MNIMKMKTPCNAINTSKNANGDIVVASAGVVASFMFDVIISIIMHIDIVTKRNAILWALIRIKSQIICYSFFLYTVHSVCSGNDMENEHEHMSTEKRM